MLITNVEPSRCTDTMFYSFIANAGLPTICNAKTPALIVKNINAKSFCLMWQILSLRVSRQLSELNKR